MIKLVAAIILMVASTIGYSGELALFGVPLRASSREDIRAAILQAGATSISKTKDVEMYDARKIGLPGATKLEVVFLDDRFVLAQYTLNWANTNEERFRKMLTSKYGQPNRRDTFMNDGSRFDAEYVEDGKYFWSFDGQMEIVFSKAFGGSDDVTLSYVSRMEQSKLKTIVEEKDRKAAEEAAAKDSRKF